ncbi:MAG TPA: alpha/beta hydrolase [Vicinamibacterales bacterium]
MSGKRAVQFRNRDGLTLVGIVHEPAPAKRSDVAVILLSPGVKNRVAPHRLYNKIAERCVAMGYWVLRFDFSGLGDSEGFIGERYLADLYRSVGLGRYVDDTWAAMDWMRQTYPVKRFIIGGLCGGAITGVLAAPRRADVAGILALGLPVALDGRNVDRYRTITAGQLNQLRAGYLRKLRDPRSWLRLISLRTDWRLLWRSLTAGLSRRRKRPSDVPPPDVVDNTNWLFAPAFLELLSRGCPALLLFSELDRLWWEFEEKFLAHHREALKAHNAVLEIDVIAGANHVFTLEASQSAMLRRVEDWLQRRFSERPAAA